MLDVALDDDDHRFEQLWWLTAPDKSRSLPDGLLSQLPLEHDDARTDHFGDEEDIEEQGHDDE